MSKFKVGDKAKYVDRPINGMVPGAIYTVTAVLDFSHGVGIAVEGKKEDEWLYVWRFEEVKPVQPEPQVPGIPEGYRLVRVGEAKQDELYVINGSTKVWSPRHASIGTYAIVEPISPPEPVKPKTRVIKLTEYVVWDEAGEEAILECSYDPSKETETPLSQWKHAHPTGNTREIEVPLE